MRTSGPLLSSLRWRLFTAALATLALALFFTGLSLQQLFEDHVTHQFELGLARQLDQVTARLDVADDGTPRLDARGLSDPRWEKPYSDLYWQIDRIDGTGFHPGVLRSRSLWDFTLMLHPDALAPGTVHHHALQGPNGKPLLALERTVRTGDDRKVQWRLIVASDMSPIHAAEQRFSGLLILSLGVLFALLLAASVVQVHIGLAPLRALRTGLARVKRGEVSGLAGQFPQEVQPLVDDFNSVLVRNAEVVSRARTQAGNLAHAVKTPLAVLQQAGEAALADAGTRELGTLMIEQIAIARRHIHWHMARSRAAAAAGLPGHAVAVGPVLEGLVRAMHVVHAGRKLKIVLPAQACGGAFAGEAQDLQELLGNLLDNACKWAHERVEIGYALQHEGDAMRLSITLDDDGPGIAPERRDAVLRRGVRLDESVPGTGLGLSIAAELAGLYQGGIVLENSPLGGLRVRVELPAAPGMTEDRAS
jgi:signal transduction histidine kinase